MDDSQLLRVTASPTDVETLARDRAAAQQEVDRLSRIVAEQRRLLDAVRAEIEQLRQRFGVGTRYHEDSVCGSCGGPLEVERDAVCVKCTTEIERDAARDAARYAVSQNQRILNHLVPIDDKRFGRFAERYPWLEEKE